MKFQSYTHTHTFCQNSFSFLKIVSFLKILSFQKSFLFFFLNVFLVKYNIKAPLTIILYLVNCKFLKYYSSLLCTLFLLNLHSQLCNFFSQCVDIVLENKKKINFNYKIVFNFFFYIIYIYLNYIIFYY